MKEKNTAENIGETLLALLQAADAQLRNAQGVMAFVQEFVQRNACLLDGATVNLQTGAITYQPAEGVNEAI